MKKYQNLIFIIFFIHSISIFAKENGDYVVTVEALKETQNANYPSASATVLREKRYISSPSLYYSVLKVEKVVKIYNNEGLSNGIHEFLVYKGQKIRELSVINYSLQGDKIVSEEMDKEEVYRDEIIDYQETIRLAPPNVKKGNIIVFKYEVNIGFLPTIYIQQAIPIKELDVKIAIPTFFDCYVQTRGEKEIKIIKTRQNNFPLDCLDNIYQFSLKDIEPYFEEPFVDNIENYISGVEFYIRSYSFPNGYSEVYARTWDDVLKKYQHIRKNNLAKTSRYKKEISMLLKDVVDEEKKIKLIYDYVRDGIKWNEKYSVGLKAVTSKVFKDKIGNSGSINMLLLEILKYAKIEAAPVYVATRQKVRGILPNIEAFNHMIVQVTKRLSKPHIYLDAINKNAPMSYLGDDVLMGKAMGLSKADLAYPIDLVESTSNSEKKLMLIYNIKEDLSISGKLKFSSVGNESIKGRKFFLDGNEGYQEKIKNHYKIDNIKNVDLQNLEDTYKPLVYTFDFVALNSNFIFKKDDKIYINPLLFLSDTNNPFKEENRSFPITYPHTFNPFYALE